MVPGNTTQLVPEASLLAPLGAVAERLSAVQRRPRCNRPSSIRARDLTLDAVAVPTKSGVAAPDAEDPAHFASGRAFAF